MNLLNKVRGFFLGTAIAATAAIGCENPLADTGCPGEKNPWGCTAGGNAGANNPDGGAGAGGNDAGSGGNGGNTDCHKNPNFNNACTDSNGKPSKWACDPNDNTKLICPNAGGGTGGDAGTGGSGGSKNCKDNPNFGDPCIAANGQTSNWICDADGIHLTCPNPSGGTGGDGGSGGSGGGTCTGSPCKCKPDFGTPCPGGTKVCAPNGLDLYCLPSGSGGGGSGGTGGDAGSGGGGGGIYNCLTDDAFGDPCSVGLGPCKQVGIKICRPDGNGLKCNVSALPAPSSVEICGNGIDDDCNGAKDNEEPLVCPGGGTGGSSGAGGDAGAGGGGGDSGSGGGSGSGGSGGSPTPCTPVSPVSFTLIGSGALGTLKQLEVVANNTNPQTISLNAGQRLAIGEFGCLSILVNNAGKGNLWADYTPAPPGDPTPLMDAIHCDLLSNPVCDNSVIGNRTQAGYLTSTGVVWECVVNPASCPPQLTAPFGLPGNFFFSFNGVLSSSTPLSSYVHAGQYRHLELSVPPLCP
ncbi:hypothetical protein IT412_01610 [Candidatus Peregrinibacteria bacterium]|nr:hypothetical protein [Candidatus Peregrinibacteria bacterium]